MQWKQPENIEVLMPPHPNKDVKHRIHVFLLWLDRENQNWRTPDLAAYRDALLHSGGREGQPLSPVSVQAHMGTIKGRYLTLLKSNTIRDSLYGLTPPGASPADRKAMVDESLTRLENAISIQNTYVSVETVQDRSDSQFIRLSKTEADRLLHAPRWGKKTSKVRKLRDTAILSLLLSTGVREMELVSLDVSDLHHTKEGHPALLVRSGKGNKTRLVLYGALTFGVALTEKWLETAGISEGPIFRGLYRGGRVRPGRLHVRAVNKIVGHYPIVIGTKLTKIKPHDLRRSYARFCYEAGMKLMGIQQNLGHADVKTTQRYIGDLNADLRKPPQFLDFDVSSYIQSILHSE